MNDKTINLGDVVGIIKHTDAPYLYPDHVYTEPASSGWVVTSTKSYYDSRSYSILQDTPSDKDEFTLEKLPEQDEGWTPNQTRFIERRCLVVEKTGTGKFTRGVDLPFNQMQARDIRFSEFRVKVATAIVARGTHEGWSNPKTWHVNLCLTNCRHFVQTLLPGLWRKDGSINPNRLYRVWLDLRRMGKVEDFEAWMYASPIDVPDEFTGWNLPELQALRVDWNELAADLARKPAVTPV